MILHLRHRTSHPLALDILLRAAAIVMAAVAILGLLPAMVEGAS